MKSTDIKPINEVRTVPIVGERLDIDAVCMTGDVVRVELRTDTHTETIKAELTQETAHIRHVAKDTVIDAIPEIIQDGETTIIPIVEERLVTRKELVLVEEIHITKQRDHTIVEDSVSLRRQIPEISRKTSDTP